MTTLVADDIEDSGGAEGNAAESFRSHRQYLRAFGMLAGFVSPIDDEKTVLAALAQKVRDSGTLKAGTRDANLARASLANAWSTELLISLTSQLSSEDEYIRITNTWTAIQTYYVAYHATQALCVAKGMPRPDSHPKTQKQFVSLWVNRPRQLPPWTFGIQSDAFYKNLAVGTSIDHSLHSWSHCSSGTCWSLAAKALRTTREEAIRKALSEARNRKKSARHKAWEEAEADRLNGGRAPRKKPKFPARTNLTAAEKYEAEGRVRTYSLLDYLYRLRIRANYEDATMFLDGPEDDVSSRQVHDDLRHLAASVLLIHEVEISKIVGAQTMKRWICDWLANVPAGVKPGLLLRQEVYDSAV